MQNRIIKQAFILSLSMGAVSPLWAMQALDDQTLSATTGQDGIKVAVSIEKIQFNEMTWIDNTGIDEPIANRMLWEKAGVTVAGLKDEPVRVDFVGNPKNGASTFDITLDAASVQNKAVANIGVKLSDKITGIKMSPIGVFTKHQSILTAPGNRPRSMYDIGKNLIPGVTQILEIGSKDQNFEISFVPGKQPSINIQLGNTPQGFMVQFGGAIQSICGTANGCPIALVADNTSAKFNFQAKATDQTNGFSLANFHSGISKSGVFFGNTGESSKMNISINQVMLGNADAKSALIFNGLANGSMGSFGAVGASVKDLKVYVSGL